MLTSVATLLLLTASCSGCDSVWHETQVRHERPRAYGEFFDPQESDPKLANAFAAADRKAERAVGDVKRDENFIFRFWCAKKRILKDEYGIDWKSPAELSPTIEFDDYGQPKLTENEKERVRTALSSRIGQSESIIDVWREFDGKISLTTKSSSDQSVRIYHLTGPDGKWVIEGPFEIAFD